MASRYRCLLGWQEGARKVHVHLTEFATEGLSGYEHTHRAEEAIFILEGRAEYTFGGRRHKATPGELIFFPSGVAHARVKYLSPTMKYLVIRSVEEGDEPCCCGGDRPPRAGKPPRAPRRGKKRTA